MTRLFMLFFFIIVSRLANAQSVDNFGMHSNHEANSEENDIIKFQKTVSSSDMVKEKHPIISSAARRSTIINTNTEKGDTISQKVRKDSSKAKSVAQARRPTTDGRPVQINIPVVPVPAIAKPDRMTIPNRRISLPIGKS